MTMSNRKFGIEIECQGADRNAVIAALREVGVECIDNTDGRHGGIHTTAPTWKIVLDGSVSRGFEMVSPILSGEDGLTQVRKVARVLAQCGAQADNSCGLHVHVDARDLNVQSIVNVARRYARFESEIDALMPRARNRNQYCGSLRNVNFDRIVQEGIRGLSATERYLKVNLSAYARHSTIEFRHHSGTTSGEKMENWIKFCTAFVDASVITETPVVAESPAIGTATVTAPAAAPVVVARVEPFASDDWGGCTCYECDRSRQMSVRPATTTNTDEVPY